MRRLSMGLGRQREAAKASWGWGHLSGGTAGHVLEKAQGHVRGHF